MAGDYLPGTFVGHSAPHKVVFRMNSSQVRRKAYAGYKGRRLIHREIPPPILERDEASSAASSSSPVPSPFYSSMATFDMDSSQGSSNSAYTTSLETSISFGSSVPKDGRIASVASSLGTSMSSSIGTSRNASVSSSFDSEEPRHRHNSMPGMSAAQGHRWQRQLSMDATSNSLGSSLGSKSTFEEVESIDFNGSHELELHDLMHGILSRQEDMRSTDKREKHRHHGSHWHGKERKSSSGTSGSNQSKGSSKSRSSNSSYDRNGEGESKKGRRRMRDLIVPDENVEDPYPFAKHVFNKKDKEHKEKKEKKQSEVSDSATSTPSSTYGTPRLSLFDQLLQYKIKHQISESSMSNSSFNTSSSPKSNESPVRYPFESDYEYYVRMRRPSSSTSGGVRSRPMSRTVSIESSSSSNYSSSSPDAFSTMTPSYPYPPESATAEEVLLNLGFGGGGSFLPERFAKDWYSKILEAKQERIYQQQQSMYAEFARQQSQYLQVQPLHHEDMERANRYTGNRRYGTAADFLHKLDCNSRTSASSRRAKLRRAATTLTYPQQSPHKAAAKQGAEKENDNDMEKQDSIDMLKNILERQANIMQSVTDVSKEKKRKAFGGSRQQSLPLFLETLKEEDEHRGSQRSSLDSPSRNGGKLKEFLEDEERLSRSSSKDSESSKEVTKIFSMSAPATPGVINLSAASTDTEGDFPFHSSESLAQSKSTSSCNLSSSYSARSSHGTNDSSLSLSSSRNVTPDMDQETKQFAIPVPSIVVNNPIKDPKSDATQPGNRILLKETASLIEDKNESGEPVTILPKTTSALQVEPAMVSVVLSDVSDVQSKTYNHMNVSGGDSSSEDHLLSPSANSMSLSPCPLSPITVIEMEHLDNQIDSTDSGENVGTDSPDNGSNISNVLPSDGPNRSLTFHIPKVRVEQETTKSNINGEVHVQTIQDASASRADSPEIVHRVKSVKECSIEADDGTLSPLALLSVKKNSVPSTNGSESAYESSEEEKYNMDISVKDEKSTQADDGTLSPIIFLSPSTNNGPIAPISSTPMEVDEYYIAVDIGTQYDMIGKVDAGVQTDVNVLRQISSTQTSEAGSAWHRSFSDFEPQYFMTEGCQTDSTGLNVSRSLSWGSRRKSDSHLLVTEFKDHLCRSCKDAIAHLAKTESVEVNMSSEMDSSEPSVLSLEVPQQKGGLPLLNSADWTSDCDTMSIQSGLVRSDSQTTQNIPVVDNEESDEHSSVEDMAKLHLAEHSGKRLSYIEIMEMLERSESVPDYLERNIDIPKEKKIDHLSIVVDLLQRSISMPEDPNTSFDLRTPEKMDSIDEGKPKWGSSKSLDMEPAVFAIKSTCTERKQDDKLHIVEHRPLGRSKSGAPRMQETKQDDIVSGEEHDKDGKSQLSRSMSHADADNQIRSNHNFSATDNKVPIVTKADVRNRANNEVTEMAKLQENGTTVSSSHETHSTPAISLHRITEANDAAQQVGNAHSSADYSNVTAELTNSSHHVHKTNSPQVPHDTRQSADNRYSDYSQGKVLDSMIDRLNEKTRSSRKMATSRGLGLWQQDIDKDASIDAKLQGFDLEGLLTRIDRIENMISSVMSLYMNNALGGVMLPVMNGIPHNQAHRVNNEGSENDGRTCEDTVKDSCENGHVYNTNTFEQTKPNCDSELDSDVDTGGTEMCAQNQIAHMSKGVKLPNAGIDFASHYTKPPYIDYQHFDLQPSRKLTKTTSMDVGGFKGTSPAIRKLMLAQKRSSLQRQSNFEVHSPSQNPNSPFKRSQASQEHRGRSPLASETDRLKSKSSTSSLGKIGGNPASFEKDAMKQSQGSVAHHSLLVSERETSTSKTSVESEDSMDQFSRKRRNNSDGRLEEIKDGIGIHLPDDVFEEFEPIALIYKGQSKHYDMVDNEYDEVVSVISDIMEEDEEEFEEDRVQVSNDNFDEASDCYILNQTLDNSSKGSSNDWTSDDRNYRNDMSSSNLPLKRKHSREIKDQDIDTEIAKMREELQCMSDNSMDIPSGPVLSWLDRFNLQELPGVQQKSPSITRGVLKSSFSLEETTTRDGYPLSSQGSYIVGESAVKRRKVPCGGKMVTKSFSLDDPVHIGWHQSLESSDSPVSDGTEQLQSGDDLEEETTKANSQGKSMSRFNDTKDDALVSQKSVVKDKSVVKTSRFSRQSSVLPQENTSIKTNPDSLFVSVAKDTIALTRSLKKLHSFDHFKRDKVLCTYPQTSFDHSHLQRVESRESFEEATMKLKGKVHDKKPQDLNQFESLLFSHLEGKPKDNDTKLSLEELTYNVKSKVKDTKPKDINQFETMLENCSAQQIDCKEANIGSDVKNSVTDSKSVRNSLNTHVNVGNQKLSLDEKFLTHQDLSNQGKSKDIDQFETHMVSPIADSQSHSIDEAISQMKEKVKAVKPKNINQFENMIFGNGDESKPEMAGLSQNERMSPALQLLTVSDTNNKSEARSNLSPLDNCISNSHTNSSNAIPYDRAEFERILAQKLQEHVKNNGKRELLEDRQFSGYSEPTYQTRYTPVVTIDQNMSLDDEVFVTQSGKPKLKALKTKNTGGSYSSDKVSSSSFQHHHFHSLNSRYKGPHVSRDNSGVSTKSENGQAYSKNDVSLQSEIKKHKMDRPQTSAFVFPDFSDLDESLVADRERMASEIVTDIFDNIHDQLVDRTESMSEVDVDYTVLRAVNHTIDKLFQGQTLPDGWPVGDNIM